MRKSDKIVFVTMLVSCLLIGLIYTREHTDTGTALCINEIMGESSEVLVNRATFSKQWIELYNGTDEDINLKGYGLSTIPAYPFQFVFGEVTISAGGYLVVLAKGDEGPEEPYMTPKGELYTNFSILKNSGLLLLSSPDGERIDMVSYAKCLQDISYGRSPDGGDFVLLKQSSRGDANGINVSLNLSGYVFDYETAFSHEEGVYPEAFYLELSAEQGDTIFYTLDGSEPNAGSPIYQKPILIQDRSEEQNRYAGIPTDAGNITKEYGQKPVKKATVVRTRLYREGHFSSAISSRTYWIGEPSELLTISLVSDPKNLFDFKKGILVPGILYGYYMHGKFDVYPKVGNYSQRGNAAVRKATLSFFEDGELVTRQNGGVRVTAGLINAARGPIKRLRLISSLQYETEGYEFPAALLFPDTGTAETKGYEALNLRNSLNFVENALTDAFVTRLVNDRSLGTQVERPVVLYIDGEYWGVSYLAEVLDEAYITRYFHLEEGNVALFKLDSRTQEYEIQSGGTGMLDDYLALLQYAEEHDLSKTEHYEYICERLDIDNYIKNYVIRLFLVCTDWPDNNIRAFRAISPDGSAYGDGKWRYILFDNDYAALEYDFNMFTYAMGEDKRVGRYDNERLAEGKYEMFVSLMENAEFRARFRAQYESYKKTMFNREYMNRVLDEMVEELGAELEQNSLRWSSTSSIVGKLLGLMGKNSGEVDQMQVELNTLEQMREFIEKRADYMDEDLEEIFARYE